MNFEADLLHNAATFIEIIWQPVIDETKGVVGLFTIQPAIRGLKFNIFLFLISFFLKTKC
jgi:hypothetical protein